MLAVSPIPSLDRIISLIKRINPTRLGLSEADRERGYRIKNGLQNLLLENYGEYFQLVPHPYSSDIVLLKHHLLPTIDACHTPIASLSAKALESVKAVEAKPLEAAPKRRPSPRRSSPSRSVREIVKKAEQLLDAYEYEEAAEILGAIRIVKENELPALIRGVKLLTEEMGAYQRAVETLLSQPKWAIGDRQIRELLALAYHHNGMKAEARSIFESISPGKLGTGALYAHARIGWEDGDFPLAYRLLQVARKRKDGAIEPEELRRDVLTGLLREVEPDLERARAAFQELRFDEVLRLTGEVLRSFPGCRQARELLGEIGSRDARALVAMLWDQLEMAEGAQERLEILGRLLERDRDRGAEIKRLMEAEKTNHTRSLADERFSELRELAAREAWPECLAVVRWFLSREDRRQKIREICEVSPLFHLLCHNRRLQRLSDQEAARVWLDYLAVTNALAAGRTAGCLETLEELRPYLGGHPHYKETKRRVIASEQDGARARAEALLRQILAEDCSREKAENLSDALRRALHPLPSEERTRYLARLDERLEQFKKPRNEEPLLDAYRTALLHGCGARARSLRESITDRASRERIAAEVADHFRIETEPVRVTVDEEMPIDLLKKTSEFVPVGMTGTQVFLREGDDAMVVLNLKENKAVRYRSPHFKGFRLCDAMSDSGDYLFWDTTREWLMWRARLGEREGAFTATIKFDERLGVAPEDLTAVRLSAANEAEYFCALNGRKGVGTGRFFKYNLADKGSVTHKTDLPGCKKVWMYRHPSGRDRFLVITERDIRLVNKNLSRLTGNRRPWECLWFDLFRDESQVPPAKPGA